MEHNHPSTKSASTHKNNHAHTSSDKHTADAFFEESDFELKDDDFDIEAEDIQLQHDKASECGCGCRSHHSGY